LPAILSIWAHDDGGVCTLLPQPVSLSMTGPGQIYHQKPVSLMEVSLLGAPSSVSCRVISDA
jgi:hypothetical protein